MVFSGGRRSIYESAAFVKSKSTENKNMSNLFAQPDSPEASIRCLSSMSISSRSVAINLTVLKEPASSRAYSCFGKPILECGS
jgi:hypothetical protein